MNPRTNVKNTVPTRPVKMPFVILFFSRLLKPMALQLKTPGSRMFVNRSLKNRCSVRMPVSYTTGAKAIGFDVWDVTRGNDPGDYLPDKHFGFAVIADI